MNRIRGFVNYSGCGPAPKPIIYDISDRPSRAGQRIDRGRKWSDEEKALLRKLWPTSTPKSDIALTLGRRKCAINHMASVMGLTK